MARKFLLPLIAGIIIVAMLVPGCGAVADTYTLTVASTMGGSVTEPTEGTHSFDAGTVVDLVADPDAGWVFSTWLGATAGIANVLAAETTVTMNADYGIIAEFAPDVEPAPAGWEPVELKLLIRIEDERWGMGDYFGDLMEEERMLTDRMYLSSSEAAPFWQAVPPTLAGEWHMYTGGWVSTLVSRDESGDFFWFYCGVWGWGPYAVQDPDPAFYDVCYALYQADYPDMATREALFEDVLFMASADSSTVHTVTVVGFNPWHSSVNVAPDMSAGVYGSRLWGYTIHKHDGSGVAGGGTPLVPAATDIQIAMPSIVTNPWNPIDGSNWVYDMMPIRAAGDDAFLPHPVTGFWLPQRVQAATMTVQEDLPMVDPDPVYTAGYLTIIRQANNVTVADDAWVDWDVTLHQFITAGEKKNIASPYYDAAWEADRGTSLRMSEIVYEDDIYLNKWHDGSVMSLADFVMMMIYPYERGLDGGLFYDQARYAYTFSSWYSQFRGVQVVHDGYGSDPLTIRTWSDSWTIDPDWCIDDWFPYYAQGSAGWHNVGIGIMAEFDGTAAFSLRKATADEIPWMNYVYGTETTGGPPLLDNYLQDAILAPTSLPYYALFNGLYGFAAEATTRLTNLDAWYTANGNFWVGTGPLMIETVDKGTNQVTLARNPDFRDLGSKWLEFCEDEVVPPVPPAHTGAWVDNVYFSQITQGAALYELESAAIHLYAFSISDGELFYEVLPGMENIRYSRSYGSWSEFLFNPVLEFDDGTINPFGDPELREAIQWLIDRDTIADEIYGGMAEPKFSLLTDVFPEAAERYPHIMTALQAEYASDPEKAKDIIWARMEALGFVMYYDIVEAKALWHYDTGA